MKFHTRQIRGKGRGTSLGFPTINMAIPADFTLAYGVYAVKVAIEKNIFLGAMHYGPIPTFGEIYTSLEVFLIDTDRIKALNTKSIQITIINHIREIYTFTSSEELIAQINEDVSFIRRIGFPRFGG